MDKIAMEIHNGNKAMKLFESPSYQEWYDNHNYEWRARKEDKKVLEERHNRFLVIHLRKQGKMIKEFMK